MPESHDANRHPHQSTVHIEPREVFSKHSSEMLALRFSPDGNTLLSTDGNVLHLWHLTHAEHWSYRQSIDAHARFPTFSPDGTIIIFRDDEHDLQVYSTQGQQLATMTVAWQGRADGIFSPDGHWFITGDLYGRIQFWNMHDFRFHTSVEPVLPTERDHQGFTWSRLFTCSPDGTTLVFASPSIHGWIHICRFDPISLQLNRINTLPHTAVNDIAYAPDGRLLALSDDVHNTLVLYETQHFQQVASLPISQSSGFIAFSPDGALLASDEGDGTVSLWSMHTYQQVTSFAAHPDLWVEQADAIGGFDWSSRGDFIATGGASSLLYDMTHNDYTVKLWKVHTRTTS